MFAHVFDQACQGIIFSLLNVFPYVCAHVFLSRQANDNLTRVRLAQENESGTNHLIPLFCRHLSFLFPLFSITYNFLYVTCIFPIALSETVWLIQFIESDTPTETTP